MNINIKAIPDSSLGAVVTQWNFQAPMTAEKISEIKTALNLYGVLVFRKHQEPSDRELVNFGNAFGELIRGSIFFGDDQQFPEILRVNNLKDNNGYPLGTGGAEACDWHSDYSYLPRCGAVSFLNAQIIPKTGGKTYFASAYSALEKLPTSTRVKLQGCKVYHDTLAADRNIRVEEARDKMANEKINIPPKPSALHPVILPHPDTGREAAYVNPMLSRYIDGFSASDSHEMLEELYTLMTEGDNIYGHEWQCGDLVMWDNIGLIHRRDSFDPHETRSMRQLTALIEKAH